MLSRVRLFILYFTSFFVRCLVGLATVEKFRFSFDDFAVFFLLKNGGNLEEFLENLRLGNPAFFPPIFSSKNPNQPSMHHRKFPRKQLDIYLCFIFHYNICEKTAILLQFHIELNINFLSCQVTLVTFSCLLWWEMFSFPEKLDDSDWD